MVIISKIKSKMFEVFKLMISWDASIIYNSANLSDRERRYYKKATNLI